MSLHPWKLLLFRKQLAVSNVSFTFRKQLAVSMRTKLCQNAPIGVFSSLTRKFSALSAVPKEQLLFNLKLASDGKTKSPRNLGLNFSLSGRSTFGSEREEQKICEDSGEEYLCARNHVSRRWWTGHGGRDSKLKSSRTWEEQSTREGAAVGDVSPVGGHRQICVWDRLAELSSPLQSFCF